jgi:hypothetical protein
MPSFPGTAPARAGGGSPAVVPSVTRLSGAGRDLAVLCLCIEAAFSKLPDPLPTF